MDSDEGFRQVKSADRVMEICELLASLDQPTMTEISQRLRIPKSSLHALLGTMQRRGWVETDESQTRYRLGLRLMQIGSTYMDTDGATRLLDSVLDELSRETGETIHLGRLDGEHVVYLAKRDCSYPIRLHSAIGRQLPAYATGLGKALLAARTDEEVDRLLSWPLRRLTSTTLVDPAALHADLAATRTRGYAIDHGESTEGVFCVAMALPLHSPPRDALSITILDSRVEPDTEERCVALLRRAIDQVRPMRNLIPG